MVSVDQLLLIPTLDDDNTICNLKSELPVYQAAVEDLPDREPLGLVEPPASSRLLGEGNSIVLLIAPSSAAVEREFSLLDASTSKRQQGLLQDHLELSLMLQYNRGRRSDEI